MLSFFLKNSFKKIDTSHYRKVVVMIGGGGMLGTLLVQTKPKDVLFINVSRNSPLVGDGIENIFCDIEKNQLLLLYYLKLFLADFDVLVWGVYYKNFTSIGKINKKNFLQEMLLNVFIPLDFSKKCARLLFLDAEKNKERNKKIFFFGSGAGIGKTTRVELASYSISKAALHMLASYAHDFFYNLYKISVVTIAPGSLREQKVTDTTCRVFWEQIDNEQNVSVILKTF